jgi:hypothetical protein
VDPAEGDQPRSPVGRERQAIKINAVMHRGDVVEPGLAVGFRDGDVGPHLDG